MLLSTSLLTTPKTKIELIKLPLIFIYNFKNSKLTHCYKVNFGPFIICNSIIIKYPTPLLVTYGTQHGVKYLFLLHTLLNAYFRSFLNKTKISFSLVGFSYKIYVKQDTLWLNVGLGCSYQLLGFAAKNCIILNGKGSEFELRGDLKQPITQLASRLQKIKCPNVFTGNGILLNGIYFQKKVKKKVK